MEWGKIFSKFNVIASQCTSNLESDVWYGLTFPLFLLNIVDESHVVIFPRPQT